MRKSGNIKLFIDAHCFDNEFQGTRTFIKELYKQLAKKTDGIDYYIAAADTDQLKKEFDFIHKAHFIKYRSGNSFARIYIETPQLIKKYKIDIAHFQYISPFRKHCKYIVTTHDILFNDFRSEFSPLYRFSRNFIFKHSILHADIKTTVSEYSLNRLVYHYGLNPNEIHVIPNGVSEKFYENYSKAHSQNYILANFGISEFVLYVSRIEPRKNNNFLLQAYLEAKLYEKGIALVFIGKTSIRSELLEETIKNMPEIARNLFFQFEQVNDQDLLNFYKAAKLFVYPSKAEGFGIPPLEAAALQIPVLCSNQTAMSDFVFFGNNFFDPLNKTELVSKMKRILGEENNARYREISDNVKILYSWKSSAEILYNLLKKEFADG